MALVDGVQVQVGARLRVDLRMSVGQLSEKVEVSSSQPLVETDSSQRGQVISGEQIRALPLVSREYSSLALLTTGVKLAGSSLTTGNTPREGAFNVNGLRSTVNNFLIDGIDNNAYGTSNQGFSNQVMQPPPDAITEFKVVTNNMSAEYGRAAGATINVNYRSGTNTIHGTAWEFLRDTSMNATGYFKPPTGKPTLDRHQFGGVFGGPLVRNKAFFFGDYEGLRQTRRSTGFATIATPTQRQGILTVDVRDPRSGVTYPAGTAIPMTDFARKVLAGLPDSNVAGTTNNYTTLQEFTADSNKGGVKVDVQFSPAAAMFARYGMRNLTTDDQPNIPLPSGGAGNGHIYARNRQFVLGSTWTPTAQSLLEMRFGYSWTQAGKNPPSLGSGSAQDQFGIPGLPTDPRIAGGLPTQLITGYSDLGRQATNPQWQYPTVYNPKINYTWLAGAHSLKSGYEFQHILTEVQDVNPLYGRDTYNGQFSRPAGIASNNLYNLADFMLGLRAQYALSSVLVANLIRNMHFAYVQDDWRIGSNLTLNLGLRYEFSTPVLGEGQRPVQLRSGQQPHDSRERWFDLRPRADQPGSQQLRPAARLRLHDHAADGGARRLRHQLRPFQPRRRRRRPPDQRPAGRQRGRQPDRAERSDVRAGGAGIPGGPGGSVAVQPADGQHHLHARRLPLQPGAELAHLDTAGADPQHADRRRVYREPGRRPAVVRQLQPGQSEQRRRHHPAAGSPAQPGLRRHHLCVQRRQVPLQGAAGEVGMAREPRRDAAQLADACRRRRTTARSRSRTRTATSPRRRTSGTWRRTSACPTITSPTTTRRASSGRCPSAKASAGSRRHRRSSTRWSAAGSSRASTGCMPASR